MLKKPRKFREIEARIHQKMMSRSDTLKGSELGFVSVERGERGGGFRERKVSSRGKERVRGKWSALSK